RRLPAHPLVDRPDGCDRTGADCRRLPPRTRGPRRGPRGQDRPAMNRVTTALVALLGGFVALAGVASRSEAAAPASGNGLPLQFLSEPIPLTIAGHPAVLRVVRAASAPDAAL